MDLSAGDQLTTGRQACPAPNSEPRRKDSTMPVVPPPPPNPMTGLQNRWYNTILKGLAADRSTAQLLQPAPLLELSDALWAYENTVPPASLTYNWQIVDCASFFGEYTSVIEVLSRQSTFEEDIGPDVYKEWIAYLNTVIPPPTDDELPDLFQQWAMQHHPDVASIGASDLTSIAQLIDLQKLLRTYQGPPAMPAQYMGGIKELQARLAGSQPVNLSFSSTTAASDVSDTWARGVNTHLSGLWTGAQCFDATTVKFATSAVTASVSLSEYTAWTAIPDGNWYDSGLLHSAYTNHVGPPWVQNCHPNWHDMFAAGSGRLLRAVASLLVADNVTCNVTSDAVFSADDQQALKAKAAAGVWPFFVPTGDGVTNNVGFDGQGKLTLETNTPKGRPLVIGATVLDIARYLGQ
ncbi:hypothetical protein [Kitasatospora sp. NPDC088346]|uniref:hypothetical protein n=1 Tax=Kitasatospora sp. NPDC088346 TaxID=3364073 RepID=UPI0038301F27